MTSWMECGCGADVVLYENPGEEFYGRVWPVILRGTCKSCGMQHITVPLSMKAEWDRARMEYEQDLDRQVREDMEKDPLYYGAVGSIKLCSDEDRDKCIFKLMAKVWHEGTKGFWIIRHGLVEREWTYHEAESEGWFNYHLKVTRWYPINGGDDSERYEEEFCCQTIEQVRGLIGGRVVEWTLWKRGQDHRSMTYSGQLPKGGLDQLLEVFA